MIHDKKLILMIKIPLIDLNSRMILYKIYTPFNHQDKGKSLIYQIEGNNLAINEDNKYATILPDSWLH